MRLDSNSGELVASPASASDFPQFKVWALELASPKCVLIYLLSHVNSKFIDTDDNKVHKLLILLYWMTEQKCRAGWCKHLKGLLLPDIITFNPSSEQYIFVNTVYIIMFSLQVCPRGQVQANKFDQLCLQKDILLHIRTWIVCTPKLNLRFPLLLHEDRLLPCAWLPFEQSETYFYLIIT